MKINQNKSDFEKWLRSQPDDEFAIAGDCTKCWIALWVRSQGFYPYSVNELYSGEVLLEDPEDEEFSPEEDVIEMEDWAYLFAREIDDRHYTPLVGTSYVTKAQAIAALESIDD